MYFCLYNNSRELQYNTNTIIVGDLNTSLSTLGRSSRQKINKEAEDLNNTIEQMYLIDLYNTLHPLAPEYTFFSNSQRTVSRIDHMLEHKASPTKFKKTEIKFSI